MTSSVRESIKSTQAWYVCINSWRASDTLNTYAGRIRGHCYIMRLVVSMRWMCTRYNSFKRIFQVLRCTRTLQQLCISVAVLYKMQATLLVPEVYLKLESWMSPWPRHCCLGQKIKWCKLIKWYEFSFSSWIRTFFLLFWRCQTKLVRHVTHRKHRRCVTWCHCFHEVLLKFIDTGAVRIGGMCVRRRGCGNVINNNINFHKNKEILNILSSLLILFF